MKNIILASIFGMSITSLMTTDLHAQRKKGKETTVEAWMVADTLFQNIPINRQIFSDNVNKAIWRLDLKDGQADKKITISDTEKGAALSHLIFMDIVQTEIMIENLPTSTHHDKIRYHKALESLLNRFGNTDFEKQEFIDYQRSFDNFRNMLIAIEKGEINNFLKSEINDYSYGNISLLDNHPEERAFLLENYGLKYPEKMIGKLSSFHQEPYADKIVAAAAKQDPTTVMIYASSTSYLSNVVERNADPFVKTIVEVAKKSNNSNRVLPFLNDIHDGNMTIEEADELSKNEVKYFNALVKAKQNEKNIDNIALDNEIAYRGLSFVRVVNELHERPANVRFASLMNHSAEELYFMMIGGQDEIYTSSFTWMFARMMDKMKPQKGDEFLTGIHHSQFRTFIRMCAGYGTIDPFLNSMDKNSATSLMKQFVANLEKGDTHDLEDAVDVADAFGGIKNKELLDFLKQEVQSNYEKTYKANDQYSKKGVIVYGLLSTIFSQTENDSKLESDLNDVIPPITNVPNSSLRNENGDVIQQVLFYGDDDGKMSYGRYIPLFSSAKWTKTENQYWVRFESKQSDNKLIIYANKPLTEPEDEVAQRKLKEYFEEKNIEPSIVIHRGHSYFLPSTIENLTSNAKVVVLGSCGGYHNLGPVLEAAPDAHIISSKQVGALSINVPINNAINDQILAGKDIDWIQMWSGLERQFSRQGRAIQELFNDYIPPNKNLGAIFIKAYRKLEAMN